MVRITRRLEFDAGHRVLNHESKCAHLHGHRYVAAITVYAENNELDAIGRVVDFSVVKGVIGKWIDDNWDHNLLLHPDDPLLKALRIFDAQDRQLQRGQPVPLDKATGWVGKRYSSAVFANKEPYVFPPQTNPTAENMARVLYEVAEALLPAPVKVFRVRLYETPNCWADYAARPPAMRYT